MHVDAGQQVHHVGALVQRDPVELHVLARREVAVAAVEPAAFGQRRAMLPVARAAPGWSYVFGQHAQLGAGEFAVGHGHAQHRRVALHVPAVLQAQRAEVVVGQLPAQVAFELVAVLRGALVDELAVELGVLVHGQ